MAEEAKTFAEFFAGIGLVDEGLRPSGWQCVYANDNDVCKQQMYESRNGPVSFYHLEDVNNTADVVERITGNVFMATASFPCIDLSLAGHYRGFGGRHSSVFFAFIDVLKALKKRRPKVVMVENVVGFLSARQGQDFASAAQSLAELGYWIDAFVLNASHFTPQSRPRVFMIAASENAKSGCQTATQDNPLRPPAVRRFMETLSLSTGWLSLDLPLPPKRQIKLEDCIDLGDEQDWWDEHQVQRHYRMMSDAHRQRIDFLLATQTPFVGTIFRRVRRGHQRAEVRFDGLAGCLRTPRGGSGRQIVVAIVDGSLRMRWMSPREYARLQGVADFPLTMPNNQLLFGFADAVCVPAIRWIDKHVLTPLYESARLRGSRHAGQSNSRSTSQDHASGQRQRYFIRTPS